MQLKRTLNKNMVKEGRKRPRLKEDENHARVGRVWSTVELRQERKEGRKERMPVVHGNKIQAHTRVHRAEIVQARQSRVRNGRCSTEKGKKRKKYAKEQETRKVTESAHVM